ncbi:RNA polymerase I associated factor A49-like protein [Laetiporus sulphureus 93-53]|uniref:RNA polymerase I associated factor A49-like protein n=1 Tax=Laetiporus sulphureus 93-53 TaxID=1314785 RepID=A0A165CRI8_9APHY|nr:RNA polymerase I associated factor A49-like protein [Laetiporus sulphureus 93-53]KZT03300.1 RNA polymerase I associated factor A49-like protein [Laetiporus sulphureus 93-53]
MSSRSNKRKRDADEAEKATMVLSNHPQDQLGPIIASFPALQPPKSTPFQCWRRDKQRASDELFATQDNIVAGETNAVEFYTSGESGQAMAGCSYLVGIHDKRTNTTVLRPAPLHILARQVKALKNLVPKEVTTDERGMLRNQLGEAFGTKKVKAAIRAQERNRVDVDAMKGVAGHLQETIMENTESLPSREEAKESADSGRLIPPHNADAQHPEDVYALQGIIPDSEFNALSVSAFKSAKSIEDRIALLPWSRSNWINQHLTLLLSASKMHKKDMKTLFYISAMFAFKMASRSVNNKETLQTRLNGVPQIVIDGLLSRFTETARVSNTVQMTPQTETMLLTYMFALCLRIDDFATDTDLIASDLSMPAARVKKLFMTLGCKIEKLSTKELKRLGLPDSAGATSRAVLRVPVQFPQARTKRARR